MRTAKPCPNRRCQSRAKTKGMNRYEHLVSSWSNWNDGCRWLLHVAGSSSPGPVAPSFFEFSATVRMSSMAARNAAISSVSFGTSLMKNMEINWQDSSLIWANYQSIIKSHNTHPRRPIINQHHARSMFILFQRSLYFQSWNTNQGATRCVVKEAVSCWASGNGSVICTEYTQSITSATWWWPRITIWYHNMYIYVHTNNIQQLYKIYQIYIYILYI